MTRQADIILDTEADEWFLRNKAALGTGDDEVADAIAELGLEPRRVMEIGCANGWRLHALRERYRCDIAGVEPGRWATQQAKKLVSNGDHGVPRTFRSTADRLPKALSGWADVLIYGFCLYLADPEDYLRIATEGDRILEPGGHIVIHDFFHVGPPYRRPYKHKEGMFAYHFDFANLWLGSPLYSLARRRIFNGEEEAITVLKKGASNSIEVEA